MLFILWSDYMIYALVILLLVLIVRTINNQQAQTYWYKVYSKPMRLISMIVLSTFIVIGLLDSIHYRPKLESTDQIHKIQYSNHVRSVLDWILSPISQVEASYSEPFATHLLGATLSKNTDGNIVWITPALEHVKPTNILLSVSKTIVLMLTLWVVITATVLLVRRKSIATINLRTSGIIAWLTVLIISCIIAVCYILSLHYHILGTDKIGVDVLYASIKSIRTGLVIGILTTIITLPFAILFGTIAGYFRGWIDDCVQYVYITLSSIPGVLFIAAAMLTLETLISAHTNYFELMAQRVDSRLILLCAILGITSWTNLCRVLRGETLKIREQDFVLAAKVQGLSNIRIISKHIIPNLSHIILISLVMDFSGLVLAEAVLTYVGVGVDPSMYSWGNMINAARMEMARDPIVWWPLAGAFIFMFILVLSANIFADGVREAFDPKSV